MDELIIGEEKYVSSKRAAELTGYAKDYIGQLCREGRVEARLVGRSWYVREAAIKDHRFGAENAVKSDDTLKPVADTTNIDSSWEKPKYEPEETYEVPRLAEKNVKEESEIVEEIQQEDAEDTATKMQEAWRTWFAERQQDKEQPQSVEIHKLPEEAEFELEPEAEPYIEPERESGEAMKIVEKPIKIGTFLGLRVAMLILALGAVITATLGSGFVDTRGFDVAAIQFVAGERLFSK